MGKIQNIKPTDVKHVHLILAESNIRKITLSHQFKVDECFNKFYVNFLKNSATKYFLKWVTKKADDLRTKEIPKLNKILRDDGNTVEHQIKKIKSKYLQ